MKPWEKGVSRTPSEARRKFRELIRYLTENTDQFNEAEFRDTECIECPNCGGFSWNDDTVGEDKCCCVNCFEDYEESLCETPTY